MSFPKNALPRDVPWTKKTTGGYRSETLYEAESAEDWLGNRFNVGQTVLYCIAAGHGQMLAVGEVLAIRYEVRHHTEYQNPETGEWSAYGGWIWEGGRRRESGWLMRKDPYDQIEVQVQTYVTSGNWNNEKRSRPAWVNPMNITAVGPSMVEAMVKVVNDERA